MRIGIIGLGTVGLAIRECFDSVHEIFFHDKKMGTKISDITENVDCVYIAVPTPSLGNSGECDTSIVEDVLSGLPDGFKVVIKSTVIPGTTKNLQALFPELKIACSPEFLRSASSVADFQNQDLLIVGTDHKELAELIFEHHIEAGVVERKSCFLVTPTQAELAKYAKNSFYSMKVIFANQFYDYCESLDEDWSVVKELITKPQMQPIGESHLDAILGSKRGFGGECLPKDTLALYVELKSRGLEYEFLGSILEDNRRLRTINNDTRSS